MAGPNQSSGCIVFQEENAVYIGPGSQCHIPGRHALPEQTTYIYIAQGVLSDGVGIDSTNSRQMVDPKDIPRGIGFHHIAI